MTIPNILREFSSINELHGVSHGMGLVDQLPENQLNVAASGASCFSMPNQVKIFLYVNLIKKIVKANLLVRRLQNLKDINVFSSWTMVIITIGTEEAIFS